MYMNVDVKLSVLISQHIASPVYHCIYTLEAFRHIEKHEHSFP